MSNIINYKKLYDFKCLDRKIKELALGKQED